MKSVIDATAFIGDYPFRGFPQTAPEELKQLAQPYGITAAVVSSFHEIFWQNNLEAVQRTQDQIGGDDFFHHFPVVNPTYPNQLKELAQLLDHTKVRGIRLLPSYHGYRFWEPGVAELFELAAAHDMVVQIFLMIQDERMHWMLKVPPVEIGDFNWLLMTPPPCKLLLSGLAWVELQNLKEKILAAPHVAVDVSRMRAPTFGIENLAQDLGEDRVVFGSLWPIQMIAPTLRQIEDAQITEPARDKILGGNLAQLMGL